MKQPLYLGKQAKGKEDFFMDTTQKPLLSLMNKGVLISN